MTSPTFTIGHRYPAEPVDVSHLDLYRFQGFSAAEWGDLEPYFEDAICFVEWPEAAAGALPPAARGGTFVAYGSRSKADRAGQSGTVTARPFVRGC